MDFFKIKERIIKKDILEVYPDFNTGYSHDLMIRGKNFYAVWNEAKALWSTDEYDIQLLIDKEMNEYISKNHPDKPVSAKFMISFDSGSLTKYKKFILSMPDNAKQLDNKIVFANTEVKKKDFVSRRLPYDLTDGPCDAYNELMGVLYSDEERRKLEWAIGSIFTGDSKVIQKFIVLYGEAGSGKSTFLNIVQKLFEGYYASFDAKALVGSNNAFATEAFRSNPLVAIQHDGDLSKIEDNSKLNSIISHEEMMINEKYKQSYTSRLNCFLFMGTNRPVKISDSKSGIIRRLIDVRPSGWKIPPQRYQILMDQINFELGAIANHCIKVYKNFGKNYYSAYKPQDMILQTNVFYNFVEDNYFFFKNNEKIALQQVYALYKEYCDESLTSFKMPRHIFREELKSYFDTFSQVTRIDGRQVRSVYSGFKANKFSNIETNTMETASKLIFPFTTSMFDVTLGECPAQYATKDDIPKTKWTNVKSKLADLDTSQVHFVKVPENHIVIDFDIKGDDGKKSLERNLEEAAKWPKTYGEYSKSGLGIHLHYIYDGDVSKLASIFAEGIEIKVFSGNSSLRRKFTYCNNEPINHIFNGLPTKGDKMITQSQIQSEIGLRKLITKNLNKEIHAGTKPSIDFIYKILEDAYSSGLVYDVSDMRTKILAFALNSTNNSDYCVKLVNSMKFVSENASASIDNVGDEIVFFDVEVFPNLFIVVYKAAGEDKQPIKMINPTSLEIEKLFSFKLIGFNCRRYDNHILYARYLGYDNRKLYELSQKIVSGDGKSGMFGEAYNLSYTDVYDFSSVKQSLKKWEIDLSIDHIELGYKWDEEVPEDNWNKVADYCVNDVIATEKVFNERQGDFIARQILADLADGSVNDTTNQLTTKLIFGQERHPQLVYTDLATGEQS